MRTTTPRSASGVTPGSFDVRSTVRKTYVLAHGISSQT
jgi:hypothetical protein